MKNFLILSFIFVFAVSCTSSPEDRVVEALQQQFNKEDFKVKVVDGLDKWLGKEASTFKSSIVDFTMSNTSVEIFEVQVDGAKASAKVKVITPNQEEIAGLLLVAAFIEKKKLLSMTLDGVIGELSKGNKRGPASAKNITVDTYESVVELSDANGWTVAPDAAKKFFSPKNKVKAKK